MTSVQPLRVIALMPLRDDWQSAAQLVREIDDAVSRRSCIFEVLLIDDASGARYNPQDFQHGFNAVRAIRILPLRRNLGHQRAIAIGLVYARQNLHCDAVIVMDADGEDTAEGVVTLLDAYMSDAETRAIFAQRSRRSESLLFKFFYHLYKVLHLSLTGISVQVGNFSILPADYLSTLMVLSELWNHYAAAVFRSHLPYTMVPIPRGTRIAGTSKMNFVGLVSHGLSAISVFGDIVGVRLLIGSLLGALLSALSIVAVAGIRLFTTYAIPGWATYLTAALAIIMIQLISIAASFTFFMLSNRTNLGFVPLRDYSFFVGSAIEIYPPKDAVFSAVAAR